MKARWTTKLLIFFLLIALLVPSFDLQPASSAGSYYAYKYIYPGKTKANLNLRTQPGTHNEIIKTMPKASSIDIYGYKTWEGDKWFYLKHGSDKGYASEQYIEKYDDQRRPKKKSPSQEENSSSQYVGMTSRHAEAKRDVNLRVDCGKKSKRIRLIEKGSKVRVKGYKNLDGVKWYKLEFEGDQGYAYADYFNLGKIYTGPYTRITVRYASASRGTNIRQGPSTKYDQLAMLPKGKTAIAYGYKIRGDSRWYYIKYDGQKGYVSSRWLELGGVYKSSYKKQTRRFATTNRGVNMRLAADSASDRVVSLPEGSLVQTFGYRKYSRTKWRYVKSADSYGYIVDSFLDKDTEVNAESYGKFTDYDADLKAKTKYQVFLRLDPKDSAKTSKLLRKNETVKVRGYKRNGKVLWYLLSYGDKKGFIKSANLNFIKSKNREFGQYYRFHPSREGIMKTKAHIRQRPTTGSSRKGTISKGTTVRVTGYKYNRRKKWYRIEGRGYKGYTHSSNIRVTNNPHKASSLDKETYRQYLHDLGFPKSYSYKLWQLHKKKPKWRFKPVKVGYAWKDMLNKQVKPGINLIGRKDIKSWLSYEKGAFNVKKDRHYIYDSRWYPASRWLSAYYLDPRNFLNEEDIFQFLGHGFDSSYQTRSLVAKGFANSFMDSKKINYKDIIYEAGRNAKVNPNVIVAMIIMEQGWQGTSPLISGKVKGYKGLYNYFNIGAYHDKVFQNKVHRGLWYAGGQKNSKGKVTTRKFNRPWTSRKKSIQGGAEFYRQNYINNRQDTYYFKKFNNNNGKNNVGSHQYMTNAAGALGEGRLLARALKDVNTYYTFYIPVYNAMPSKACPLPSTKGSNDNLLKKLIIDKKYRMNADKPDVRQPFDMHLQRYSINVKKGTERVKINAVPHDPEAKVINNGYVNIKGKKSIVVKVRSTSGRLRKYTIKLNWKNK